MESPTSRPNSAVSIPAALSISQLSTTPTSTAASRRCSHTLENRIPIPMKTGLPWILCRRSHLDLIILQCHHCGYHSMNHSMNHSRIPTRTMEKSTTIPAFRILELRGNSFHPCLLSTGPRLPCHAHTAASPSRCILSFSAMWQTCTQLISLVLRLHRHHYHISHHTRTQCHQYIMYHPRIPTRAQMTRTTPPDFRSVEVTSEIF
jgi:hypothetical protein